MTNQEAIKRIKEYLGDAVPTIEPEQKTGKWIVIRDASSGQKFLSCSMCECFPYAVTLLWTRKIENIDRTAERI